MSNTIYLSLGSLFYITIILIIYLSKKRIETKETKIYKKILITSLISLFSELYITFIPINMESFIFVFSLKIYLILCVVWLSLFIEYVFVITCNEDLLIPGNNKYNKISSLFLIFVLIIIAIIIITPIYFNSAPGMRYSYGPSVDVVFGLTGIYVIFMIIEVFKNIKKINNKKYIPIIFLIIMMGMVGIIQKINPALLLSNTCFALISTLMYFTIENPDLKLLNEYIKNKEITEKTIDNKANMLFKITEDVKTPIRKIEILSNEGLKDNSIDNKNKNLKNINILSKDIANTINNVLDISEIDKKNIKEFNVAYNTANFNNQLLLMIKKKLNNNIEFKYRITSNIPDMLYGDSSKLKQIIHSIINYLLDNMKEGIIDLDIDAIIKYDVCRLIITIRDNLKALTIDKINEILDSNTDLTDKDFEELKDINIDIKYVKKMIDLMGGTLLIKSTELGNEYTIVLNQLIYNNKEEKELSKSAKLLSNKKKVLIVDDDYQEIEKYSSYLKRNNFDVTSIMYGKDLIHKLETDKDIEIVLIDDEMNPNNAVEILSEIKNTKTKIYIMLERDKELIKEHYLNDYKILSGYILKDNYKEELNKIMIDK